MPDEANSKLVEALLALQNAPAGALRGANNFATGAGALVNRAGHQITDPGNLMSGSTPSWLRFGPEFAQFMMERQLNPAGGRNPTR